MKHALPFILVLITFSCDIVSKDGDLKFQRPLQMAIVANKSTVIDVQKLFPSYTKVDLANNSNITYFSDRYIKYSSGTTAAIPFSFVVTTADNTKTQVNVTAMGQLQSCSDNAPFTQATISNTTTLVVNLLNNPEFCNYDNHSGIEVGLAITRPGIDTPDQNIDGVSILLCSCGPIEGIHAVFTYIPPKGFVGQVKIKYYLHAGAASDAYSTYGDAIYYDPQYSQYFSAHDVVITVTN